MEQECRKIKQVESRKDKRKTYAYLQKRYSLAVRDGFLLEAFLIDFDCLEDRLNYILYHLGFSYNEIDFKCKGPQKKEFQKIIRTRNGEKATLDIGSTRKKIAIIRDALTVVKKPTPETSGLNLVIVLRKKLNDPARIDEILTLLDNIGRWLAYRNEIIHALMHKNLESIISTVGEQIENGHHYFRDLDKHGRWIERKGIRTCLKLKERTMKEVSQ